MDSTVLGSKHTFNRIRLDQLSTLHDDIRADILESFSFRESQINVSRRQVVNLNHSTIKKQAHITRTIYTSAHETTGLREVHTL